MSGDKNYNDVWALLCTDTYCISASFMNIHQSINQSINQSVNQDFKFGLTNRNETE